jgi:hypothetical protein
MKLFAQIIFLLSFFWVAPLFAQIDISELYKSGQAIEARCACAVPEDGHLTIHWSFPDELDTRTHSDDSNARYIWAPIGEHTIEMMQVIDFWKEMEVLVPNPTEEDPTGLKNPIKKKVNVWLKPSRFQQFERKFKVIGKTPDPDPDPDDEDEDEDEDDEDEDEDETEPNILIIVEESGNRPSPVASILDKLRQNKPGKIEKLYIIDKDNTNSSFAPFISLAKDRNLPYAVGGVLVDGQVDITILDELPLTYSGVEKLLEQKNNLAD